MRDLTPHDASAAKGHAVLKGFHPRLINLGNLKHMSGKTG